MNKIYKCGIALGLCVAIAVPLTATGCGSSYDAETRPLTMSIGAMDGNFNPFFYTAQNDGTVVSMTQVSMLASDASGNAVCGEDRPTVAKDYTITSYDSQGNVTTGTNVAETEYSFLIKNGMKFSDGVDLTVMDVLFSLYVNLDWAYTGSSTIYSSDIQGLNAYRQQDPTLGDDTDVDSSSGFYAEAQQRMNNLINYCSGTGTSSGQVLADIETIKELFREEVTSDWTTVESSFSSRDDTYEYSFTETWEAYYLNEGIISVLTTTNANGSTVQVKDDNGKYMTTLYYDAQYNTNPPHYADEMEDAASDEAAIKEYTDKGASREDAIEYVKRDWAIETVYNAYTSTNSGIAQIAQYWASGTNALEQFVGEARTAYYDELKKENGGELLVKSVSGITVDRVNNFNGKDLGETYDVLKIKINGVDPKAIWNFSFTVSPMHYYSDKEHTDAAMADYEKFKQSGKSSDITHFGVEFADSNFFTDVLQDSEKNRLPVGAGAYKASSADGGAGTADSFYNNKYVNYVRNDYFYTMGSKLSNAKIKYLRYREMGDDKVVGALTAEEIDYGTPNATADNSSELTKYNYLNSSTLYDTSGYGYVGINPKFVPDHEVRVAIMKAMNTNSIVSNYYTSDFASTIYRPMSKTSWAYPKNSQAYYSYTTRTQDIIDLVESAGWYDTDNDGVREKNGEKLKITFTIAGESTDHPAYAMFTDAADFLNECGFEITVRTDIQALKKLATGNLAVWAAAWSSAIDPDMYQVYHKDSTASSVKNWNYSGILNDTTGTYAYEYQIIQELSDLIDQGRATTNKEARTQIYSQALDKVMELAVELPTYQRKDNEVFNSKVIDRRSLTASPSTYVSLIDRIWEIEYN